MMRISSGIFAPMAGVLCLLWFGAPIHADEQATPTARGVLRAVSEASLSADTSLRVVRLPVHAGQAFKTGDLLIAFDCERLDAERIASEAEARSAQATYENAARLHAQRAAGALEVTIAKAQADKASAGVQLMTARMKSCQQFAPYQGRVVEVMVHEHDTPAVNAPLIKIIDTSDIEVDLIVPSHWLRWLTPGSRFGFKVDETGSEVSAEVTRLGAVVDPVSQTVKITGKLDADSATAGVVVPGMSGTAVFKPTS